MKSAKILLTSMMLLLMTFASFAANNNPSNDEQAVKQSIETFVKGVDSRNVDAIKNVISSDASFVTVNTLTKKNEEFSHDGLVDQVQSGKMGGWVRNLSVSSVDVNDNVAMAKVEITDARLKRVGYISLVKGNDGWKIVSEVSTLGLNK